MRRDAGACFPGTSGGATPWGMKNQDHPRGSRLVLFLVVLRVRVVTGRVADIPLATFHWDGSLACGWRTVPFLFPAMMAAWGLE